ncbi:Uncharacterised protein [Mycobacteroides abscessus subsp. abscessus]|uniref:hypothetical protein n=1 Tax=Mycobacteroides abscessus TaxID=36809 RepID=UPI000268413B|nr:hypothetical protein [Mycobacteroides abscessus]EIV30314.1 hypothetical protein MA3A0119R_0475 [Mycobacteroides abscessus 3A-0119-R]EIV39325.1 hypothetical protein MA3A0122R_0540 [Mycobacteroides abscessus 3A-0122-R]EIV41147.1 hypothetical protein MA3A0731_1139 [Mycobacteroides abscessus 3A-0731]EIV43066.1 hypothetical protein MA3A0122S_0293 [Mycobacteroides abscessus 3A-0122-S]EIV53726.1 hypothetical protein MA3A0930S_2314 [Mycobacteroides abscessus 3A-0930-S]
MPRFRNTVGGSVVNIDDGLATRLAITENPAWEPLDDHAHPATTEGAATLTGAEMASLINLDLVVSSETFAAIVPENTAAAPAEPKAPAKGKSARKPSTTDPEGAKDACGTDHDL